MSRDISDRWDDADEAVAIGGPVTELADGGEFPHDCEDCGASYRSPDATQDCCTPQGQGVLATDGSGAMGPGFHAAACHIERDGRRVAAGALLPSGAVAVEWNREAFPEGERTEYPTTSLYRSIDDAEEASGGSLVVDHAGGPSA